MNIARYDIRFVASLDLYYFQKKGFIYLSCELNTVLKMRPNGCQIDGN